MNNMPLFLQNGREFQVIRKRYLIKRSENIQATDDKLITMWHLDQLDN